MKLAIAAAMVFATSLVMTGAGPAVTFVDHEKVSAALAKGAVLIDQSNLQVRGSHRDTAGQVEVHDRETDVIYVIEGEATFVTGGKMIGGKQTTPGQHLGDDIQGGESRHLVKGDVIVVAAGTPHWFKTVPRPISYYVVKVIGR